MVEPDPFRRAVACCAVILPVAGLRQATRSRATPPTSPATSTRSTRWPRSGSTSGNYEDAAKLFDEVERQHPYSVWARRAQLMSAFSYYMAQKYPDAISSAQRFLTIHPGNKDAPYANYLIAMSYYQQIEDVTRDQKITQQASDAFGELIRRYPESRYAADARLKLDLINDHLAGKEMEIGRFYQRQGNWLAASIRFRDVVDKYQTTSHTPEALERLVESYLALGIPRGGAEGGGRARPQLSGQRVVRAQLRADRSGTCRRAAAAELMPWQRRAAC